MMTHLVEAFKSNQASLKNLFWGSERGQINLYARDANETRQLASYSNSTRSKLGQNSTRVSSTRNVNESSRATRNSTRKARKKLENILYIKF